MAVARYELEPYYSNDGTEKFHYVIDVFCVDSKQYYPRVYRYDYFNVRPSSGRPEAATEEMLVVDDTEEWRAFEADSINAVIDRVLLTIEKIFT